MLMGYGLKAAILIVSGLLISVILGVLTAAVNMLLETPSVTGYLSGVNAMLPQITRIAVCVLILLITALMLSPLRVGRSAWFLSPAIGIKRHPARVMYWLKPSRALRSTAYVFALRVIKFSWACIFFSPGLFLLGGTLYTAFTGTSELNLLISVCVGSFVLLLVGIGFYAVMVQRYFLVIPLLVSNPTISFRTAVRASNAAMDGSCLKIAKFKLSFAPWILSCILILPAMYVIPYYKQSCACHESNFLLTVKDVLG